MSTSAIIGAAGSVLGGLVGGIGAKDAAKEQASAIKKAISQNAYQFGETQRNFSPYLKAGSGALDQQLALLGLGGLSGVGYSDDGPNDATIQGAAASFGKKRSKMYRKWLAANPNATNAQKGAYIASIAGPEGQTLYQGLLNSQQPVADPNAPSAGQGQQEAIEALKASPMFTSLYDTGNDTILQNAAATGGLRGGNAQNSLAQFSSSLLATVIQNQLSNLGGISGQGAGLVGSLGQISQNNANANSTLQGQLGNANATATAAPYAALQGIISQLTGGGQASLGNFFGGGGGSSQSLANLNTQFSQPGGLFGSYSTPPFIPPGIGGN